MTSTPLDPSAPRLVQHVFPLSGRRHDTTGAPCWCEPRAMQPCVVCGDRPGRHCFDCGGRGFVDEWDPSAPLVVVHRMRLGQARPERSTDHARDLR